MNSVCYVSLSYIPPPTLWGNVLTLRISVAWRRTASQGEGGIRAFTARSSDFRAPMMRILRRRTDEADGRTRRTADGGRTRTAGGGGEEDEDWTTDDEDEQMSLLWHSHKTMHGRWKWNSKKRGIYGQPVEIN